MILPRLRVCHARKLLLLLAILPHSVFAADLFGAPSSTIQENRQQAATASAPPAWYRRTRVVSMNDAAVAGLDRANSMKNGAVLSLDAGAVTLNLFDGVNLQASLLRLQKTKLGNLVWHGRVAGGGEIVLSRVGDSYAGAISQGGNDYRIESIGGGRYRIVEIDPAKQLSEAEPRTPETGASAPSEGFSSPKSLQSTQSVDDGSEIDLLVTYNQTARDAAGGTNGIQSKIEAGVGLINDAFSRSGIHTSINLVAMEEVEHGETSNVYAAEDWAKNDPGVHDLRNKYAADLVFYVTRDGNNFGVVDPFLNSGNANGYHATSQVRQDSLLDVGHFGHELGHLMGCDHAGDQYNYPGRAFYYYSYGYDGYPSHPYRTIVSKTATGSTGIHYFSSPYLSPYGFVIGSSGGSRPADNVRTINNTKSLVAGFRNSADRNKVNIVPILSPLLL